MAKNFEYKGYTAKIAYSDEDDVFFGTINGISDLVTFEGTTLEELKKAFREAVDDYLDICKRYGKEPDKEYKGSFNVRVAPELHRKAALEAAKKGISLNQLVENALREYLQGGEGKKISNVNIYNSISVNLPTQRKSVAELWNRHPKELEPAEMGYARKKGVCQ